MRKFIASSAVVTAMVLGGAGAADAGNAYGKQCPKATKGAHGQCVKALAKAKKNPVTTTTTAPVVDPVVDPVVAP